MRDRFYPTKNIFSEENLIELTEKGSVNIKLNSEKLYDYKRLIKSFKENLDSLYGISEKEVERLFKDAELIIETSSAEFKKTVTASEFSITQDLGFIEFNLTKVANSENLKIELIKIKEEKMDSFFSDIIASKIYSIFLRYPTFGAHIFPVERNSIYTFSKELSVKRNMLID